MVDDVRVVKLLEFPTVTTDNPDDIYKVINGTLWLQLDITQP